MWIDQLRVTDLRRFTSAELSFSPGPNVIVGPNGAGKTSLLEAVYLLSHGRSFRRGGREALARAGASGFQVFGRIRREGERIDRLGLARMGHEWVARRNDAPVERLSDLLATCAVCCFEPGSHELISGRSDERRAFLDWGVFHVEPNFLASWRRYQRALKQRNVLLKARAPSNQIEPWSVELAQEGEQLTQSRAQYARALGAAFETHAAQLLPELGQGTLTFHPGWDDGSSQSLLEQLHARLGYDLQRGITTLGPHRADWRPRFERVGQVSHLSRGQEKLTALCAVLAQAAHYHDIRADWPIIALDDLPSELDAEHRACVVNLLNQWQAQVLMTATDEQLGRDPWLQGPRVFHVEPDGQIRGSA